MTMMNDLHKDCECTDCEFTPMLANEISGEDELNESLTSAIRSKCNVGFSNETFLHPLLKPFSGCNRLFGKGGDTVRRRSSSNASFGGGSGAYVPLSAEDSFKQILSVDESHSNSCSSKLRDSWNSCDCDECKWTAQNARCHCAYDEHGSNEGHRDAPCLCEHSNGESPLLSSSIPDDCESSCSSVECDGLNCDCTEDFFEEDEEVRCTCADRTILATTALSSLPPMSLLGARRCAEIDNILPFYDSLLIPYLDWHASLRSADNGDDFDARHCDHFLSDSLKYKGSVENPSCSCVEWVEPGKRSVLRHVSSASSHNSCICSVLPNSRFDFGRERRGRSKVAVRLTKQAQLIAQSIGQAFQVAYAEFLKANGIEDPGLLKDVDYQEVLNQQQIFGEELNLFSKKELQKEVLVTKLKGEALGVVMVESGWGSMLPTVVIANLSPSGAAARSNRLNIGDQIISLNGVSLVGLPLSTCQNYIKATRQQTVVKLTLVSCAPVVEVLIKRPDAKYQLGFSVQNGVICSLLRGGIGERGGVRVGHRIIEINAHSMVAVPHEKIVHVLATSVGEIHMKTMQTSIFRLLTGQDVPHYI